ncbi:MAG: hypothetical protein JNL66_12330 [Alphaproteobacteria bacterium]|nr:hypothetical protein [Alphaproteobacteria bacterium]
MLQSRLAAPVLTLALAVGACAPADAQIIAQADLSALCSHPNSDGPGEPAGAFREFLATRPTPDAVRQRHPALRVVLPGQPTTMEFRRDCRRFFVTLDAEGRVTGGRFN